MTEEEKKIVYRNVVYRLRIITNKIDNLNSNMSSTKNTIKQNITINDQGFKEKDINDIINSLNNISYSIKNNIIPSLNRKIYN